MKKLTTDVRLSAGSLSAALRKSDSGITLCSIRDTKLERRLLSAERSLFSIKAKNLKTNEVFDADSTSNWGFTQITKTSTEKFLIVLSDNSLMPGITVTIYASTSSDRITWKTSIQNDSKELSVIQCDYPALSFDAKENVKFFSPYGCGEIYSSTKKGGYSSEQNYPSYGASMQYLAFWDTEKRRGIYCGAHDPAPAYKKIYFSKKDDEKQMTLKIVLPLTETTTVGNSQELCGKLVWQIFDGDWYDAALIYRDWVFSEASWSIKGKEIPEWLKKTNHWWLVHNLDGFKAEDIAALNKDLGVGSATHIYYWHEIPFDNDYPHYFPIKQKYLEEIKKLKDMGIRTMPYINGRLWDTRDKGTEDWQFSSKARPYATKDKDGKPFIETYNAREADGSKVELAIMCPSTAVWQEKVKEITSRLFGEVGVDAVYIDQIAAAKPNLCEDKTHNHPAGGGTWWCSSYANLLEHVCRSMSDENALTTECTADPFMRYMDAYLSWLWVKNDQVPAFPAIYSDYIPYFGLSYGSFKENDDVCYRVFTSQALLYGEQMGWIRPQQYEVMQSKDFYKKLVRTRAKLVDFFCDGRMLRPPFITDDAPRMESDKAGEAYGGIIDYAAVQGALWQNTKSGEKLLILVNTSYEKANANIKTDAEDGVYKAYGDVSGNIKIENGSSSVELSPSSVVYCIIP